MTIAGTGARAATLMVIDRPGASVRVLQVTLLDRTSAMVRQLPRLLRTDTTRSPRPPDESTALTGVSTLSRSS